MRLRRGLLAGTLLGLLMACGNATPEDGFDGGLPDASMPDGGGTGILDGSTPGYSPAEIDIWPIEGFIDGELWTFGQGATEAALSVSTDHFAHFRSQTFTSCEPGTLPDDRRLWTMLPRQTGEFYLFADELTGDSRTVVFNLPGKGERVAAEGLIVIEEITATTIRGGLLADFDHENFVNGQFVVDVCP